MVQPTVFADRGGWNCGAAFAMLLDTVPPSLAAEASITSVKIASASRLSRANRYSYVSWS